LELGRLEVRPVDRAGMVDERGTAQVIEDAAKSMPGLGDGELSVSLR
jgi:hypothetical protein